MHQGKYWLAYDHADRFQAEGFKLSASKVGNSMIIIWAKMKLHSIKKNKDQASKDTMHEKLIWEEEQR